METWRARLDGWKEIASELGVSERTARRYEVQERLPVRGHMHEARGSVYAWSDELASWKHGRSTATANDLPGKLPHDCVLRGCEWHGNRTAKAKYGRMWRAGTDASSNTSRL